MLRPDTYALAQEDGNAITITAAGETICDIASGLDGLTAVSLLARFVYGSGGSTVKAYVQTRIGEIWVDIACFAFTTANAVRIANLSGLTPKTTIATPTDGALGDDSCVDGIMGDALRLKIISTGTYAGSTTLDVRAACR